MADRDDEIDWGRLDRFVTGQGSPSERRALEHWVNADPTRRSLADAMRSVGRARPERTPPPDARRALLAIQQRLGRRHSLSGG